MKLGRTRIDLISSAVGVATQLLGFMFGSGNKVEDVRYKTLVDINFVDQYIHEQINNLCIASKERS